MKSLNRSCDNHNRVTGNGKVSVTSLSYLTTLDDSNDFERERVNDRLDKPRGDRQSPPDESECPVTAGKRST